MNQPLCSVSGMQNKDQKNLLIIYNIGNTGLQTNLKKHTDLMWQSKPCYTLITVYIR